MSRTRPVFSDWESGFVKGRRWVSVSYVAEAATEINLPGVAGLVLEVAILDIELVNEAVYVIGVQSS